MARDLNDTLIFVKVVEHGSFISAARALRLPKTTVSRKVQDLEVAPRRAAPASHHAQARAHRSGQRLLRTLPAHRARTRRSRKRRRPVAGRPARLAAHHRAVLDGHRMDRAAARRIPCAPSGSARGDGAQQRTAGPDRQGNRRRAARRQPARFQPRRAPARGVAHAGVREPALPRAPRRTAASRRPAAPPHAGDGEAARATASASRGRCTTATRSTEYRIDPVFVANDPAGLRGALLCGEGLMLGQRHHDEAVRRSRLRAPRAAGLERSGVRTQRGVPARPRAVAEGARVRRLPGRAPRTSTPASCSRPCARAAAAAKSASSMKHVDNAYRLALRKVPDAKPKPADEEARWSRKREPRSDTLTLRTGERAMGRTDPTSRLARCAERLSATLRRNQEHHANTVAPDGGPLPTSARAPTCCVAASAGSVPGEGRKTRFLLNRFSRRKCETTNCGEARRLPKRRRSMTMRAPRWATCRPSEATVLARTSGSLRIDTPDAPRNSQIATSGWCVA